MSRQPLDQISLFPTLPPATPAPVEAGATTVHAVLAEIRSDASSLEIFAWAATDPQFNESHQQQMQEAALMMLASLEALHGELKQAIAGEDRT